VINDAEIIYNDIIIPSDNCRGNNYCQNESFAEQECGVSIPCPQRG